MKSSLALTVALTLGLLLLATPILARQEGGAKSDTITTPSGLKYIITRHGTGAKPLPGNVVIAQYTGTFLDGKVFDSSRERNEPFAFTLGKRQVIKGWDEGFALLHVGDRATLIIPPALAYGDAKRDPIPPGSTLVFDVELLDLKEHSLADYLGDALSAKGAGAAREAYKALTKQDSGTYFVSEAQLNSLGYQLMNGSNPQLAEAIEIFAINVDLFPNSFNVYDSIAEAYMNSGDTRLAIVNYRKSLELNPKNENAVVMLKKLEGARGQ